MTLAALVSPPDLLAALVMAPAAAAAPAPIIVPALSPREVLPPAVPAAEPRPAAAPDPAIDVGGSTPLVGAPPRPDALVPSPAAPRLAGQVFAVALHAAALAGRRRGIPDGATATTAPFGVVASAATLSVPAAPLDLRRADWPARMVDHIELLRDAADAVSTRIRISPDALGPVDVQVRRDGDELHVHLIAQHAETRALLSEAQPQLSSLAAERGVRLGQTSVGAGTGGESSRQQPASGQRTTPPRPASAPTHADHPDIDDTRIA